ncbi:MAG: helix-turn-helix domain-containing protein [Gemmatimonadota bacterium]|nr:helix-turn-helix domain-containing protein [Gemmatimonadota bacterium]
MPWRVEKQEEVTPEMKKSVSSLEEFISEFPPSRRKLIEARTRKLIAEEMSLRELRAAQKRTQASVAKTLGVGQDSVSRLEKRSDLLLSTLRSYIEAVGGRLSIVVEFPNRKPVILSSFSLPKGERVRPKRRPVAHA